MDGMEGVTKRLKAARQWDEAVETELRGLWRYGIERVANRDVRMALVQFLGEVAPLGFFVNPASSTGRHHPKWQCRRAGILRNTIECCLAVDRQLRIHPELTDDLANPRPEDRDIVLAATILSDTFKYGEREITEVTSESKVDPNHGRTAAERWRISAQSFDLATTIVDPIFDAIFWHLGRFTPGWTLSTTMSLHSSITHRIDMFFADKNLELIFEAKTAVN